MALGATASDVQRLMVRQALTRIAGGGLGLLAAAALSRLLESALKAPSTPDFLFGVGAVDPATFVGLSAFAILVATAASYIRARRASTADPLARCGAE